MGAPSGTTWGNIITGSKSTTKGRIGIYVSTSNVSSTVVRATVEIWYWSMYALSDVNNVFYADWDKTSATTSKGASTLKCTVNTGSGWSTSNQMKIATYTKDYNRSTSSQTKYFSAKITRIENHGLSNTSSHYVSFTIPALQTYTITYDANGGVGAPSSQTKYYGTTLTLSSTIPTRTGYTFSSWKSTRSNGSVYYAPSEAVTYDGDQTLVAVWEANTYTVSYNANGGSNAPASQTKTHGVNLTLSTATPTRTNYNFVGWGVTSLDTTPTYNSGGTYSNNASITLYAIWSLGYTRPRISDFYVTRCDSSGNFKEDGTYALVHFDWTTDKTGVQYRVYYKPTTDSSYSTGALITMSGTSGTVNAIIKATSSTNMTFDIETSYDIQLNVSDSGGYTATFSYLNSIFIPIDSTGDGRVMSFGEPAPDNDDGLLKLAYPTVDLAPSVALKYRGDKFFGGTLLWQGNSVFTEASTVTFSRKVSEQRNGLLFVFSRNGDYNFMSYFVPKELIANVSNASTTFMFCTSLFDYIGQKTLYITDTQVTGHTDNDATGKNATSGITYHNEAFFLRYIYGV